MLKILKVYKYQSQLLIQQLGRIRRFYQHKTRFYSSKTGRFKIDQDNPYLLDSTATTEFDAHYLYHVAWACRKVKQISPQRHIDISSSLNFCTTVSAFIPTEFYDYRPAQINLNNLSCNQMNLLNLTFEANSIESLSCMHVVEHVGLGRYGDPIDYNGDLKAVQEISRVVRSNGHLLFVVPVAGTPALEFNAHRIYSYSQIIQMFAEFDILEHALVTDQGDFLLNPDLSSYAVQKYGCGCFWFRKKAMQLNNLSDQNDELTHAQQ